MAKEEPYAWCMGASTVALTALANLGIPPWNPRDRISDPFFPRPTGPIWPRWTGGWK